MGNSEVPLFKPARSLVPSLGFSLVRGDRLELILTDPSCVSGTLQQVPGGFGTVTATYGNSSAVRTAAYLSEPAATPDAPTGNATVPYVTSTPPYCGEDEERPLFY